MPEPALKPPGSYLSSLSDFAELLGVIESAEHAANELLEETGGALHDAAPKTKAEQSPEKPDLNALLCQLDALIGLRNIKSSVRSLINLVKVRKLREENGLTVPPVSLHMVFTGNPGTGKTTVARILSSLFCAIGVLSKGQLVEVDRSGLVAGYVGQTAMKTSGVIQSALGGILFIDEAYALVSKDGVNDFGHEAIETLLKAMEDHRDDFIVIVAGYDALMAAFIASNPGLQSRFNRYFAFDDYTSDELGSIFKSLCEQNEYVIADDAAAYASAYFDALYAQRDEHFGNARDVRNFFENAVTVHSDRVSCFEQPTRDVLMLLTREDLENAAAMT
ncbi:AAA family ATPase [Oscillospiraceae bacterium CM]|nr:AAA family ATPase [Oscillospiraceae bacterium CM]